MRSKDVVGNGEYDYLSNPLQVPKVVRGNWTGPWSATGLVTQELGWYSFQEIRDHYVSEAHNPAKPKGESSPRALRYVWMGGWTAS